LTHIELRRPMAGNSDKLLALSRCRADVCRTHRRE
jgi:hypothetical protein